ncbi:ketose-bisphosphate aldolase [Mycoplasma phocoeninasale]|uniref:Ketose-bisphosphate aldolase n=1 Tax=Mycoplasma phocoeninasale TaxID=2726117 RepID=A0A858U5X5_9MOLU|nr:ketose-bisphosphate aldolase [Mycoplasma phocoeninasale]QJG66665.1 ketose-bisphosphate aldolase [Mycoplasma phocoeninasale]
MKLVNIKHMLAKAYREKYAVSHININNLEWTKNALEVADELKAPIIISASVGAVKYFGGYNVVSNLVKTMIKDLNISTEVALHLDHGNYEDCIKALNANFSSIMYDGSHEPFSKNYENTKALVKLANAKNASVEAEIGTIGGEEDGVISSGELVSDINEAIKMKDLGIDALAVGINNIHGKYPLEWKSLNFELLDKINQACKIPLVLHGGSGIPKDQVKKSISLGIAKININTELQIANAEAIKEFVLSKKIDENKNYDPRKIANYGMQAIRKVLKEKFFEFGSANKAKIDND